MSQVCQAIRRIIDGALGASLCMLGIACGADERDLTRCETAAPPSGVVAPERGGLDPTCSDNGCLREVTEYGAYATSDLEPALDPRVTIDNGYSVWRIRYMTDGREARASMTVPFGVAPPADGWPVAVNNPGTVGLDDPCALGNDLLGTALAGYFGARGMIGVAVDYPGLGTPGVHPYLVADVEGRASLDAARAALQFAAHEGFAASGQVVIAGLSQGGHATLAAARLHHRYAPELDVRAFAAAGPASVSLERWAAGVTYPGPHQTYHAMLVYAWADHYNYLGPPLWSDELAPRIATIMAQDCAFSGTPTIGEAVGEDPEAIFAADFLAAYSAGDFHAYPGFTAAWAANRSKPFVQTAPLRIYQGSLDNTVPESSTAALVRELRDGGVDVEYIVVPGAGHTDVAFSFLGVMQVRTDEAIAWLRERLHD